MGVVLGFKPFSAHEINIITIKYTTWLIVFLKKVYIQFISWFNISTFAQR